MASNRKLIDRVNEAFSRGDIDAFIECCTDDVRWTMFGEGTFEGKASIRQWLEAMESEPPRFAIKEIIEAGDRAVVWGEMSMDDDEDLNYAFCDIYQLRGGKVAELRSFVVHAGEDDDEYEEDFEDD